MKNTITLNKWMQKHKIDIKRVSRQTGVLEDKMKVSTNCPYTAEEFLNVCAACHIDPESIFKQTRRDFY